MKVKAKQVKGAKGTGGEVKAKQVKGAKGTGVSSAKQSAKHETNKGLVVAHASLATRALVYSLKSKKGGRQLEVVVQLPRSTPDSVLSINADEEGLSVNTGKWGGGYAIAFEWPTPFTGKVRAGKDIEVEANLQPGRLQLLFDLEKPDGVIPATVSSSLKLDGEDNTSITSKKSSRAEPGPNKKKREKAKEKKKLKPNTMKKVTATTAEAEEVKSGLAMAVAEGGQIRKKKRLVEAKNDVLTFIESIAGAKEAEMEEKLAKEKARDQKISQIHAKQDERKAAKEDKKKKLLETLKSNVKASKGGKSKQANPPHDTESRGSAQEERASEKKRKRISWGADEERQF